MACKKPQNEQNKSYSNGTIHLGDFEIEDLGRDDISTDSTVTRNYSIDERIRSDYRKFIENKADLILRYDKGSVSKQFDYELYAIEPLLKKDSIEITFNAQHKGNTGVYRVIYIARSLDGARRSPGGVYTNPDHAPMLGYNTLMYVMGIKISGDTMAPTFSTWINPFNPKTK